MLVIPTRSTKNGHVPSPWVVDYHILGFLILKGWQVDLHCGDLSLHMLICGYCGMLSSMLSAENFDHFLKSELPTPEEGEPPEKHLGIPWYFLPPTLSTISTSRLNVSTTLLLFMSMNIISSHFPIKCPLIQTSHPVIDITWWQLRGQVALLNPWGHPGPLAFIFFSMMVSAIAWQVSYTVFTVTATCAVLLTQLTGLLKQSSMSFAFL